MPIDKGYPLREFTGQMGNLIGSALSPYISHSFVSCLSVRRSTYFRYCYFCFVRCSCLVIFHSISWCTVKFLGTQNSCFPHLSISCRTLTNVSKVICRSSTVLATAHLAKKVTTQVNLPVANDVTISEPDDRRREREKH
ncbi:hypothetical protein T4B_4345 [Trichinella pseudospiralis]|uniref:Uncharacterized protein n=1 Tax=Trichinella pseudospiralis TaxID=6337 RepID=A0A0V1HBJ1_TRIPS|nr:hypothetical protein T4B_4345 [Trichinella pseudospiralis]